MDGGFVPTPADTDAGDLRRFCGIVSRCAGRRLDPATDRISVSVPSGWHARNTAGFLVLCRIGPGECVIIKRCLDDPGYLRRELLIASVKSALGWEPRYPVIAVDGVRLRGTASGSNPVVLDGWEGRPAVMIYIGNPDAARDLGSLDIGEIDDLEAFCRDCGRWAVFNYLFGVRDRNASNFMFLTDTQELHSIDNEEGPFDPGEGGVFDSGDIIVFTRLVISRFISAGPRHVCEGAFRAGFMDGWRVIMSGIRSLSMLNEYEMGYLRHMLAKDPDRVAREFVRGC